MPHALALDGLLIPAGIVLGAVGCLYLVLTWFCAANEREHRKALAALSRESCPGCGVRFGNVAAALAAKTYVDECIAIQKAEPDAEIGFFEYWPVICQSCSLSATFDADTHALWTAADEQRAENEHREAEAAQTPYRCPNCGSPCPGYRLTCRYCEKTIGRGVRRMDPADATMRKSAT